MIVTACDARWKSETPLSTCPSVWDWGFLSCVSTPPLWECFLTARYILKIEFPLLWVELSIVRVIPSSISLSLSTDLVGCDLRRLHLQCHCKNLLSRWKGLTFSSRWSIPLSLLMRRHHSNPSNDRIFALITWHELVGHLVRWPWWQGPVSLLKICWYSLGLWFGVPISMPCWLVRIGLSFQVVLCPRDRVLWLSCGKSWGLPASFSGVFVSLWLCPHIWYL